MDLEEPVVLADSLDLSRVMLAFEELERKRRNPNSPRVVLPVRVLELEREQ